MTHVTQPKSHIQITPNNCLIDEPVTIRLVDFPSKAQVTLRAKLQDDLGRLWQSWATFKTDATGQVDLTTAQPQAGTYQTVDPMGLFWSLALPAAEKQVSLFYHKTLAPKMMHITAELEVAVVAKAHLTRHSIAPDVRCHPVRENGFVGLFFQPARQGPHPGIIVLGGSEGGICRGTAAMLASHGFAVLALAYFGLETLPKKLFNYPLSYFGKAIDWLQAHPDVAEGQLGMVGVSKGGELALLLATTFSQIGRVVAYVPSDVVFMGFGNTPLDFLRRESAWSYQGSPLPFVPFNLSVQYAWQTIWRQLRRKPLTTAPLFERGLVTSPAVEKATIPVEQIRGDVLIISGEDDGMWPSTHFGERIMSRLARHHHPYHYEHLAYPGAGHVINFPYTPTTITYIYDTAKKLAFEIGGEAQAAAYAQADSWPRVLQFLAAR